MALLVSPLLASTRKPNMVFGTIYNFRHLHELGLTPQYIGNAAAAREFIMPRHSDTIAIAATLRQLAGTLSPTHVKADLQYMQANVPLDEGLQHHAPFITQQFGRRAATNRARFQLSDLPHPCQACTSAANSNRSSALSQAARRLSPNLGHASAQPFAMRANYSLLKK